MFSATRKSGEAYVYSLECRNLDCAVVRGLRRELLYSSIPILPLILDLEKVEFADSSGMGLLSELKVCLGDAVVLAACSTRLMLILDQVPGSRLPSRYSSVAEAQAAMADVAPRHSQPALLTDATPLHARASTFGSCYVKGEVAAHGSNQ